MQGAINPQNRPIISSMVPCFQVTGSCRKMSPRVRGNDLDFIFTSGWSLSRIDNYILQKYRWVGFWEGFIELPHKPFR